MKDLEFVREHGVIAIVRGQRPQLIRPLAEALFAGGVRLIEVTFAQHLPETWGETASAISMLARDFAGRILPGAGTVLTNKQLLMARDAGAKYIISPNVDEAIIRESKRLCLLSFPGAMTPSEVVAAHNAGADMVKLFPAGNLGADYVKSLCAPLPHIPLMAVGGIDDTNARGFIEAGCIGVGVGGNLVNKQWIADGEWHRISAAAQAMVKAVRD